LGRKYTPLKGECGDGKAKKERLMNEEIMSGG
jgi:hypothetical protein